MGGVHPGRAVLAGALVSRLDPDLVRIAVVVIDRIGAVTPVEGVDVVALAALERVVAGAPVQRVIARPAVENVIAGNTKQLRRTVRCRQTDADEKLKRLYRLVEDGLTDLDEVLQDRLNALKADRDRAKAALERAKEQAGSYIEIDPALIERFGRTMRENFSTGSVPFRKAYLQSLIDVIEVDDHQIRIKGSKDLLEKAVLASQSGQAWCSQMSTKWRASQNKTANMYVIEVSI